MPAQLLTRRPDIFVAEANLKAANADLLAARAALFPSLSLTASGGVQNPALNAAVISLSGAGPTLNLGASLTQTIFDHGRLQALRAEADKDGAAVREKARELMKETHTKLQELLTPAQKEKLKELLPGDGKGPRAGAADAKPKD